MATLIGGYIGRGGGLPIRSAINLALNATTENSSSLHIATAVAGARDLSVDFFADADNAFEHAAYSTYIIYPDAVEQELLVQVAQLEATDNISPPIVAELNGFIGPLVTPGEVNIHPFYLIADNATYSVSIGLLPIELSFNIPLQPGYEFYRPVVFLPHGRRRVFAIYRSRIVSAEDSGRVVIARGRSRVVCAVGNSRTLKLEP